MRALVCFFLVVASCAQDVVAQSAEPTAPPSRVADAGARATTSEDAAQPIARVSPEAVDPATLAPGKCPDGMVYIPPGTFLMGLTEAMRREEEKHQNKYPPQQLVTLTKAYCIDKTEVTAGAYRKCVAAGVCRRNSCNAKYDDTLDHPMNCMSWGEADTYCRWMNKRLPTEAEWEYAARGKKGARHPWGNTKPDDTKLWYSGSTQRGLHTAPVGSFPKGASPFGLLDMEGNVGEWVNDWDGPQASEPCTDPPGPAAGHSKVMKGGSAGSGVYELDIGQSWGLRPSSGSFEAGMRCAVDARPR